MKMMEITLNPLTDGFVVHNDTTRADGHALVIATNGAFRLTDIMEAKNIIDGFGTNGGAILLGSKDFIVLFNDEKAFDLAEGRFFVGSMLVMRIDGEKLLPILDEEIAAVQELLNGRMTIFVSGDQQFSALVLS